MGNPEFGELSSEAPVAVTEFWCVSGLKVHDLTAGQGWSTQRDCCLTDHSNQRVEENSRMRSWTVVVVLVGIRFQGSDAVGQRQGRLG